MAVGAKPYNTFVAGLITEAGPLTFPENASHDELNCILFRKGNRRRRLGIDYENSYALSSATITEAQARDKAIRTHVWSSVAGNGNRNFLIIQLDSTLHYYDLSTDPLSNGKKSFTTDLNTYKATGVTDVGSEPVSVTSGRGLAIVSSKTLEPFTIEYIVASDTITVTPISLQIRDFDGVDDSLEPDEEPSSLTAEHSYNLKNQGWNSPGSGEADPTTTYQSSKSVYPSNSKQWWIAKDNEDIFKPDLLAKFSGGNTLAPRGHWLLNPFYKDRSTVSGVAGITVESEANRVQFVQFFAGRIWYFGVDSSKINGNIFFSQVLTDVDRAGKCYQEGDPTSEENNELLDDDGGVIVIPEIGSILGSLVVDRFLIIFASNGCWAISGASNDGFKATDFQVNQVTTVGCNSTGSIIEVESKPYWWSETGIYTIAPDQISGRLTAQSLTQNTIETFYQDEIPSVSKAFAQSVYDPATKRIYWFYNTVAPTSGNQYTANVNAALIFDTSLGAFYPWQISSLDSNSPVIAGVFNTKSVNAVDNTELVADSDGDLVIRSNGDSVVVDVTSISGSNTFLKWFFLEPTGSSTYKWTFGLFNNGDYIDWETKDGTGKTYESYVQTGFEIAGDFVKKKTPPYIYVYFDKSETATAGGALVNPSSCFLTTKFDWTESGDTGKWSTRRQIYRLKRYFDSGIISTHLPGETLVVAKEKIRGRGRAIQFRFESESGKDFNIHGWQAIYNVQDGL
tara:strand:- start:1387 stop:3597 length:2211 start_codon:yes stop_codon:yes gene_type:complete